MHRWILEAGLAGPLTWAVSALGGLCGSAAVAADGGACPAPQAAVLERYVSADCADCTKTPPSASATVSAPPAATAKVWLFDWVVPGTETAPLAASALTEARDRALRGGGPAPTGPQTLLRRQPAAPPSRLRLQVQSGPAWSGYLGVQFSLRGAAPAGASGWLALVELLPAGSEGGDTARQLVRAVAGPLSLKASAGRAPIVHLQAMRWPASAQIERLQARAWVEDAQGQMLAVTEERCAP